MTWKAVLVLALLAQPAAALSRATTAEKAKIRALLENVTVIEDSIKKSVGKIDTERRKLKRNYAAIATEEKKLARLREQKQWAFQRAMRATLRAYDIVPVDANARSKLFVTIQGGIYKGQKRRWIPLYKEPEPRFFYVEGKDEVRWPDIKDDEERQKHLNKIRGKKNGVTFPDGLTMIWPEVGAPLDLARLLLHERRIRRYPPKKQPAKKKDNGWITPPDSQPRPRGYEEDGSREELPWCMRAPGRRCIR